MTKGGLMLKAIKLAEKKVNIKNLKKKLSSVQNQPFIKNLPFLRNGSSIKADTPTLTFTE